MNKVEAYLHRRRVKTSLELLEKLKGDMLLHWEVEKTRHVEWLERGDECEKTRHREYEHLVGLFLSMLGTGKIG